MTWARRLSDQLSIVRYLREAEGDLIDEPRRLLTGSVTVGFVWWALLTEPRPLQPLHALASGLAILGAAGAVLAGFLRHGRAARWERRLTAVVLAAASLALMRLDSWYGPGLGGIFGVTPASRSSAYGGAAGSAWIARHGTRAGRRSTIEPGYAHVVRGTRAQRALPRPRSSRPAS